MSLENSPVGVNISYLWKGGNLEGLLPGRGSSAGAPGVGYLVWEPGSHGEKCLVPSEHNEHSAKLFISPGNTRI